MEARKPVPFPKSTISPERQIALPESALDALSLKQGGQVRVFISEGVVSIAPVRTSEQLHGASPKGGQPEMHEKEPIFIRKATIGTEGQITLPEEALQALSLKRGGQVRLFISVGEVGVMPVHTLSQMAGMLRNRRSPLSQKEMDEAITQAICERAGIRY